MSKRVLVMPRAESWTMSQKLRCFVLTGLALCCVACSGGGGSSSMPASAASPVAPAPSPTPSAVPVSKSAKAPFHGLLSMGSLDFINTTGVPDNAMEEINAHPSVYVGAVINVTWAQLEPAQGSFSDSSIDTALATIATYNAKYPATPVRAKLRVFAGPNVPAWLLSATGFVSASNASGTATIARFWTSSYDQAWKALQAHLAAAYDTNPAIEEVAISSCSSDSDEPFILPLGSAIPALHAAGFTDALYEACLQNAPADYSAWRTTPLDYTFNAFTATDGTTPTQNPAFTISVMQSFRSALRTRAVIANHGLQNPLSASALTIYPEFTALGSPVEFQAYSPTVDWPSSISLGLTYDASEIEIWQTTAAGGNAVLSQSDLQGFAAML